MQARSRHKRRQVLHEFQRRHPEVRGPVAPAIFSISMRVIAFTVMGLMDMRVVVSVLVAIPAGLAGVAVASHLFKRMSCEMLVRAVQIVLLATGVSLVVRSLSL